MGDALRSVERVLKVALAIKKAVDTAEQNKKDCVEIGKLAAQISSQMERLKETTEVMEDSAMRDALEAMADCLDKALLLIDKCRGKCFLLRYLKAGDMSKQLRQAQNEISSKIQLGILAMCLDTKIALAQRTQFYEDDPGEPVIPSKTSITSTSSSGHAEARRSIHSNIYLSATEPMAMKFEDLHHITDGFSENRLLGKGGCGIVYKGVFDDGEVIAVKKLYSQPRLNDKQFQNELLNLMTVQHQHIIRLVGYCSQTRDTVAKHDGSRVLASVEERVLCFEYMEGGTLEELISDESCGLDWEARYKIIKGVCQGLKYLHTGFKYPIYHLDLKPANILLDKDGIPKIGDFGLSRFLLSEQTFVTTTNSGTIGYMPPEYMHGLQISSKFDVFSLGIIIIQIIAGREGCYNYKCQTKSPQGFIDHVTENWCKRVQTKTMSKEALLEVEKCIKIALRCVEDDRVKRPTITEIVDELNMIDLHVSPLSAAETTPPA